MQSTKKLFIIAFASAFLTVGGWEIQAQENEAGVAAPESMPREIAELFGEMESAGAEIVVAPSDEPQGLFEPGADASAAASRYLFTTLRVINNSGNRGCGYGDWNCMTNLCKRDLRDNSAWRGWAGCWKKNSWICYFECGQRRNAF